LGCGEQGENLLRSFERKVLRKIFVPVLENGFWKRRKNSEIYRAYTKEWCGFKSE
jgi:hypothetical protein